MKNTTRRYTFEQFTAVRLHGPALEFSPDGSEVAYSTNTSGQFNLWRQSSAGGYPHQLTLYSEQAVRQIAWSPDGKNILYTADHHGDEFHQLYLIPARGGQLQALTNAPNVQHYLAGQAWSPNGRLIAYCGNDNKPTDMDVLIRDVRTGEVKRALTGGAFYAPAYWSPNGQHLTVFNLKSNTNTDIYLLSLKDGKARHLTPHEGEVRYVPGRWAVDGSGFYLLTDEGREFSGIASYNLKAQKYEWTEIPKGDVEHLALSKDGRFLAWTVNEDGYSRLYVRNLKTRQLLKLPKIPEGVIGLLKFSPDGRKLGLFLTRSDRTMDIFVADLTKRKLNQLTYN
ncbi:PD40 domain-containing protein, partial [Candidatus Acetothermia bacterium]|nr:PD40 domain-containing protein [Candidatus Acetothermia bacterium]